MQAQGYTSNDNGAGVYSNIRGQQAAGRGQRRRLGRWQNNMGNNG